MALRSLRSHSFGLLCALLAGTFPTAASALEVARVTRHGYIVVDEPDAIPAYGGLVPADSDRALLGFISDLTRLIDATPGAPRAPFLAVMQIPFGNDPLAFYLGLKNDTLGIGMEDPQGSGRETYDLNPFTFNTYPVTGFVYLNSVGYYTDPGLRDFGRYLICTQEFGHRFGVHVRIPERPGAGTVMDGGADDASADDASVPDDAAPGPGLAADGLLGRQRAHWSYFVHSGGSPMEGNNWEVLEPGVFRTGPVSNRFSPMDLYLMGVAAPEEVPAFFVITEPETFGQRDMNGQRLNRESPPEYRGSLVTVRGRAVEYTIDDVIRANGPRIPAYVPADGAVTTDAAVGGDAGDGGIAAAAPPDLEVAWILMARPEDINDALVARFDEAIEACAGGYEEAASGRSRLIAQVVPQPVRDAGVVDAAGDGAAGDGGDGGVRPLDAAGGCGCHVGARGTPRGGHAAGLVAMALCLGAIRRTRRTRRAARTPRR